MDFNTNGNLLQNGNPYLSAAGVPNNTTLYGKSSAATPSSSSSSVVPEVNGAVSKELTDAASTSFQRNQTDTQKVIDDYNKQIKAIESKISVLTAEKAKIEANLNNKDFSDEERRMIESYTTLGDLDAGVKQIMSNRQFKSALAQTQFNEDKYNQEAKDEKTIAYKNAVNDAASFYYTSADSSGNMSVENTKKYGVLKATLKEAALAARVGNEDADKALGAKVKQMQEEAGNATTKQGGSVTATTNAATGLDEFLNKNYETLRKNAKTANENTTFGLGNETVTGAIAELAAKREAITKDTSINGDDKITYQGKIDAVLKDLEAYKTRSDAFLETKTIKSTLKGDIVTAKHKADEGIDALKKWLTSGQPSSNNVLNKLGLSAETVKGYGGAAMLDLITKVNALK
jgi:hypothetical protein